MSFVNKVVIITGGSSGIGAATAILFAKEGADVAIVGRNEANLNNVAEQCAKVGNKPLIIKADISNDEEAKTIVKQTIDVFGKLDVLVNNAAVLVVGSILQDNLMENYDQCMDINLRAVIHLTALAAPYLIKTKGNIVNISSVLGSSFLGFTGYMAYSVAKAGVNHFSRGVALELASSGVRVNVVSPGPVRTNVLINAGLDQSWEKTQEQFKIERISEPEEVADLILYLAGEKAKSITGANYVIDCGCLIKN